MRNIFLCLMLFISPTLFAKDYKKCLENTTWIVPPSTLLAYEYINGTSTAVEDQTVWTITKYEEGYFFGTAYTDVNDAPSSQKNLVGSITPSGDVYITFYPVGSTGDYVNGIGKFVKKDKKHYFVMQMNSAQNNFTGLTHWSYMISVKPGDPFYRHLPGVGISVPDFISQFDNK